MRIKEIQNLIKFVAKSGASEVRLEMEKIKLTIKAGPAEAKTIIQQSNPVAPTIIETAPPVQAVEAFPTQPETKSAEDSKYIEIKSPIIGTFYRKPSPDKPSFVEVGDSISWSIPTLLTLCLVRCYCIKINSMRQQAYC